MCRLALSLLLLGSAAALDAGPPPRALRSRRAVLPLLAGAPLVSAAARAAAAADLTPMSDADVRAAAAKLTPLQQRVLLEAGTERAFTGETVNGYKYNNEAKGTWVSAISGVPLFSSSAKYDSGTGWPSFYAPVDKANVIERLDPKDASGGLPRAFWRTEVLDRKSGTHLGHVFPDGPKPTGLRYCMNAASLRFVPAE